MARLGWPGAAVFTVFALVQLNDPDPLGWTVIYLVTAGYSVATALGRMSPGPVLAWGALAAVLGVGILTSVEPTTDAMGPAWMGSLASEGVREGLGMLLVAGWCATLAWIARTTGIDAQPPRAE